MSHAGIVPYARSVSLDAALAAYLDAAGEVDREPDRARKTARELLEQAERAGAAVGEHVMRALSEDIARGGASLTLSAMLAGAMVEHEAPDAPVRDVLVEALERAVTACVPALEAAISTLPELPRASAEAEKADEEDELAARVDRRLGEESPAWRLLHDVYLPCVAVLGRSAEARSRCRGLLEALTRLEPYHPAASWLRQLIAVLDDEPLLVIDVGAHRGFTCVMSGVASNFELFVLLADALAGDYEEGWLEVARPPPEVVRCLRGIGPQECGENVEGAWNAYAYTALDAERRLPDPGDYAASEHWIWGEGEPWEIPTLDGMRVVLLGPPSYARFIPAQRTFSTLRAKIDAKRLESEELDAWLAKIARDNAN
jgi:hypothetical protein